MATLLPHRGRSRSAAAGPKPTSLPAAEGLSSRPRGAIDDDPLADWPAWVRRLATRRRPKPLARLLPDAGCLGWGWPEDGREGLDTERASLEAWVAAAPPRDLTVRAREGLALCRALPAVAEGASPQAWRAALDKLLACCRDAGLPTTEPDPLWTALAAVELPLTLAYSFPELPACAALGPPALEALTRCLETALEAEGMPRARWWPELPALVASWVRTRAISRAGGWSCPPAAEALWRGLPANLVRLIGPDHRQALTGARWPKGLLRTLISLVPSAADRRAAEACWRIGRGVGAPRRRPSSAACAAEEAQCAVLWADWSPRAARLSVAYAQRELNTELRVGEARLWSGLCNPSVSLDGQPSPLESDWEQICWESDGDMDYLELEVDLSARWRVQRHLLLARADRILFLADAVLGERRAAIDYRLRLPLTGEAGFAAAKDTHEGALVCRKRRFSVLPLALPEWRAAPSAGRLTRVAEGLEFSLSAQGSALFAPLLVDLDSTRGRRPLTWRRLTVAESRQIQPPDVAVGYRAQLGRQQWLVYRSLAARGNRTLLGHNTAYEFVLARFLRTGRVEPLLQIE